MSNRQTKGDSVRGGSDVDFRTSSAASESHGGILGGDRTLCLFFELAYASRFQVHQIAFAEKFPRRDDFLPLVPINVIAFLVVGIFHTKLLHPGKCCLWREDADSEKLRKGLEGVATAFSIDGVYPGEYLVQNELVDGLDIEALSTPSLYWLSNNGYSAWLTR
ncbi:hypothetical protein IV203_029562 [Nitzschia inconspicua]|uniref:Uncharacterized protein n=1 Tax=Nitzschia inconspicua TaxID=303405 RepID=A0A9K3LRA9_9STRA|nr:hypothetical protein IV203_029562 [Nitzschia inconspicua]